DLAVEGPGGIEHGVAVFEAAVAERHHDLAVGYDLAVEIGDPLITEAHARLLWGRDNVSTFFSAEPPKGWGRPTARQRRAGSGGPHYRCSKRGPMLPYSQRGACRVGVAAACAP